MKKLQKPLALLVSAAILLSLIPAAAAADGTVTIADADQFLAFAENCARDDWSVGVTAELTADLDLSGAEFAPIPIFQGTFHGNGHTISGVTFRDQGSKVGLFRTLTASAVVSDLRVEGDLTPGGSACRVGLVAGESDGLIQNCTVSGTVSGQEDVGGVAGFCGESGRIESCSSTAEVSGVTNTGGIVGQNLGAVTGCANGGGVDTAADQETPLCAGGIAGLSRGTIASCTNRGPVGYDHLGYNLGGIAGLQSGEIRDCTNTGAVRGRKDVGGIVGQFEPLVDVVWGESSTGRLSESLGALLGEMETFVDEVSAMADQGVTDARTVTDALAAIRSEASSAGSGGRAELEAAADRLDGAVTDLSSALQGLRGDTAAFTKAAGTSLDALLSELDSLNRALDGITLPPEASGLRDTLDRLRSPVQALSTQLSALSGEADAMTAYLNTVRSLLDQGDLEGALAQPLPDLDLSGHAEAIETALADLSALLNRLEQDWEALSKLLSGQLGKDWDRFNEAQATIVRELQSLLDAGKALETAWGTHLDAAEAAVSAIRQVLRDYAGALSGRVQSTVDAVDGQLSVIETQLSRMADGAAADNAALHDTCVRMLGCLDETRQAIAQLGQTPELTVTDRSGDAAEGPGLVRGCTVSADISGDTCVGGIAGTVSTELGDDPEATFDAGNLELSADVSALVTAAVRDCRFDGSVTVKNDCGGGIAGRCTAGTVTDCAARGSVETGGDYCGGVAGRTDGAIVRCAALVDLTGGSWCGGIAGLGGDVTDCRAMVRAGGSGECVGAIAGEASGALTGNRYLLEDVRGVDGVDYAGAAEGLDYEAFSALDGIPADFLTFSYRFVADGTTVAEIPFAYGDDLDLSQVPTAPERDGQYGRWPDFPTEHLTRSLVLEAQFEAPTATLSTGGELPELLAEGSFSPGAALTASPLDLPDTDLGAAQKAWDYDVSGAAAETVTLRLRAAGLERPAAAFREDGKWVLTEGTVDGSYLVVEAPASVQVVLLERPASTGWIWGLGIGLVVLIQAAILLRTRRRKTAKA